MLTINGLHITRRLAGLFKLPAIPPAATSFPLQADTIETIDTTAKKRTYANPVPAY